MIDKPDIFTVLSREGIEADLHGRFLCPFHDDKNASGKVYASSGRWRCFACNIGGDVIDFIMYRHGLTYPEALLHLGIGNVRADPKAIRTERKKRELFSLLRFWRKKYLNALSDRLRRLYNLEAEARENPYVDSETPWSRVELTQEIPQLEWLLDVLRDADNMTLVKIYDGLMRRQGQ